MCFYDQTVRSNEARSNPGEYWRSIMKDEPMPKAIQDVLPLEDVKKDLFVRNFDLKPNLIIYHSHVMYNENKNHIAWTSSSPHELN